MLFKSYRYFQARNNILRDKEEEEVETYDTCHKKIC